MYERRFASQEITSHLEDAWEDRSIERHAGQLLACFHNKSQTEFARAIIEDDKHGNQAIRRLVVLHHMRGSEARLYLEGIATDEVVEILQAPDIQQAVSESCLSPHFILPQSELQRRSGELLEGLATTSKEHLINNLTGAWPSFLDKALQGRARHGLQIALAPAGLEFVLSDAPAYFAGFDDDGQRRLGFAAAHHGAADSIIMPLTPIHFAYLGPLDPSTDVIQPLDAKQVEELNSHQCGRALRSIIVSSTVSGEITEAIRSAVIGRWGHDDNGKPRLPPSYYELPDVRPALS